MTRVDITGVVGSIILLLSGRGLWLASELPIFWNILGALLIAFSAVMLVASFHYDPPAGV